MPIPRVAIVGRPNVGKSSLLNMLAHKKVSIVDPTPGVTRDRVSAIVHLESPDGSGPLRAVEFVDTGGFGAYHAEGERYDDVGNDLKVLSGDIETQIAAAIGESDMVLFAVDSQAGITAQDQEIGRLLREGKLGPGGGTKGKGDGRARPPVRIVATKVDGPKWEAHAMELAGLGFGEPLLCSAKNNYFRRELQDELYASVPQTTRDDGSRLSPDGRPELKFAIVGKRNAGKSTLVNTLAGEERVIVSEIPGTTRDAVDVRFELDGRSVVAIDTAGLRKKKSFAGPVEWYAYDRLKLSIDRSDVVLLLVDATTKISQVDEQVAMLAQKAFKPVVIVVNKWDIAEGQVGPRGKKVGTKDYEDYLRKELRGLPWAPISFMSGATGLNVGETIDLARELHQQANTRVTTGQLNRIIRPVVERQGPPSKLGYRAKVFFVAQTSVAPPTIVMIVNRPDLFTPNYQRFLVNRLREALPFGEVPIRLVVRERKREEITKGRVPTELAPGATAEDLFAEDAGFEELGAGVEIDPPTPEELAHAAELEAGEVTEEQAEAYFGDEE